MKAIIRQTTTMLLLLALAPAAMRSTVAQPVRTVSVLEQPSIKELATVGMDHLYDLRFDEAQRAFDLIDQQLPDHPIGPFLQSLTTWWQILLDLSDESHDRTFFSAMESVIDRCDAILDDDPDNVDALFFKGAALGFRGRLRSNRGDWFKAAMDGKRAMDYVLAVPRLEPDNADYGFGKGIYDYFAAVVPDRHPYVKPVMGLFPRGDRERGLELLERTASEGHYIQTEAVYFLLQINFIYERNYKQSLEHAAWLRERYPNNAFFHAIYGRVLAHAGRWSQSAPVFTEILDRYKRGDTGYNAAVAEQALYYLARERMVRRDFETALPFLLQLEALSARSKKDGYFKVLGRLRQGMSFDALGQRDLAVQRYREVLRMKDWADSHDRASSYLDEPYR